MSYDCVQLGGSGLVAFVISTVTISQLRAWMPVVGCPVSRWTLSISTATRVPYMTRGRRTAVPQTPIGPHVICQRSEASDLLGFVCVGWSRGR